MTVGEKSGVLTPEETFYVLPRDSIEYFLLRGPTTEYSIETVAILAVVHHSCIVSQLRWILTGSESTVNSNIVRWGWMDGMSEEGLRVAERPLLIVSGALDKSLRQVYRDLLHRPTTVEQELTRWGLLGRGGEGREEVSMGR